LDSLPGVFVNGAMLGRKPGDSLGQRGKAKLSAELGEVREVPARDLGGRPADGGNKLGQDLPADRIRDLVGLAKKVGFGLECLAVRDEWEDRNVERLAAKDQLDLRHRWLTRRQVCFNSISF
jgi:hypothetical protein